MCLLPTRSSRRRIDAPDVPPMPWTDSIQDTPSNERRRDPDRFGIAPAAGANDRQSIRPPLRPSRLPGKCLFALRYPAAFPGGTRELAGVSGTRAA
ncbi:hypothetical protein Sfum_1635 [Syntrophobacter fumaroxidans MPOB]|uniref:Uncharacterized protein n=1 Tax=Syntrophobacter fumaroxidans (strain DSM 10017 / MPOB) TaxID=335543 RepID=A0LIS0_SYNFM|nr:hypothetical protein Sfum_1635 [Syntrophobacter fumaroxidans MPOB]